MSKTKSSGNNANSLSVNNEFYEFIRTSPSSGDMSFPKPFNLPKGYKNLAFPTGIRTEWLVEPDIW